MPLENVGKERHLHTKVIILHGKGYGLVYFFICTTEKTLFDFPAVLKMKKKHQNQRKRMEERP